ncbi:uncharacterized protein AC631_04520 [Debaryomyces fabryi]|uniref:Uncharacterized protein n=1 Tax=Debaryomyces fabryi TaxID=58627 RepID=A0A0V1PU54_9ASCO|nr:uncharacterized protein AC631_04520 [Debaryomyces fabryi]KRZ99711.1 hypothetical protein AC631_04520 [Debaryomyces fabryi]CUM46419.1 unnamed protein product [Debaryomyces fabryi]
MAGDLFLSDPSKKRRRSGKATSTTNKSKRSSRTSTPSAAREQGEEISGGSDSEDEQGNVSVGSGDEDIDRDNEEIESDEEFEDENAADKRRRLAKQYLDNLKSSTELGGDFNDFDAQDLDDDILARRLQVDVAESKGYVYKFIGEKVSSQIDDIKTVITRIGSKNLTGLSVRYPYLYTVSKDIEIIKWDISADKKKPQRIKHTRGGSKYFKLFNNPSQNHHWDSINCIAASPDGKFIVTGGNDSRLIIWSTENLACLKVLETRSSVNSVSFRRGTDQLYAACADLRVRTYSINQFAQLEVLYGHQDNISDISALAKETCVSVGSRDKTALFWKISEESRLTFRGGDSTDKRARKSHKKKQNIEEEPSDEQPFHAEGSIDVVSMVDESHFVTGSDNGNIALWSLAKKKALFTQRLAHGLQPEYAPSKASAETSIDNASRQIPERQPYWVTAIHAVPYSDLFVSGSFDGSLHVWRISQEGLRSFELIGKIPNVKGCVVKIDSAEIGNNKVVIHALVSKEHRLGRWLEKIEGGRNSLVSFAFDI